MTDKLKPCPFCGGEAKEWVEFESYQDTYGCYDERNLHHCGCTRCGVVFSAYWDIDFPIRAWNTRKPMDKIVGELEALKLRHFLTIANTGDEKQDLAYEYVGNAIDKAIEIVKGGAV